MRGVRLGGRAAILPGIMSGPPLLQQSLPYLTADLPGVGGVIKQHDEDFVVEEVPLYEAGGEGTHVYFMIEKRGLPTLAAISHIARALGRAPHEIGYAGLKDAHGVTRQWLSLEHESPERIESLSLGRVSVLRLSRHRNKIKLGHLAGNQFAIKIREVMPGAKRQADAVLSVLSKRGLPNSFGSQRFGLRGDNAEIGRFVLIGDYAAALALMLGRPGPSDRGPAKRARELFDAGDFEAAADAWPRGAFSQQARICRAMAKSGGNAKKAFGVVDRTLQRLMVSAFQSGLFNRVVARRMADIDRVMVGDLAWKHANGACFRVEDADVEQARCATFEISPTGPVFGRRMTEATGEPGRIEADVLAEAGLTRDGLGARHIGKLDGARRPLRVPIIDGKTKEGSDDFGHYLAVSFFLPAGAYATNVIREISKADSRAATSSESASEADESELQQTS